VPLSKFHTQDPQIFGATVQTAVAMAIWRLDLCNPVPRNFRHGVYLNKYIYVMSTDSVVPLMLTSSVTVYVFVSIKIKITSDRDSKSQKKVSKNLQPEKLQRCNFRTWRL
jgi:hypothetical protein